MTISSVSSTNGLVKQLEANGLSADKAALVGKDLEAAETASTVTIGSPAARVSLASVRAALDTRIAADISSGKLSAGDAAVVQKALDDIDGSTGPGITSQSATTPVAAPTDSAGAAGSAGSGGGGDGGGSSKTELSETLTVVGSTKTTTITYTDDTTATTTTTATEADVAKYGKPAATGATGNVAQSYLSTIAPGSLIDQSA